MVFFCIAVFLASAWLFLLFPRVIRKADMRPFLRPFAHRGLHGNGIPENSVPAFSAAAEAGYGIELDIRLTADGKVVVFHDSTLDRVCGAAGSVEKSDYADLLCLGLSGTGEHIPLLAEVLETVNGKVPLMIELKGEAVRDTRLCSAAYGLLKSYGGDYCIESFNPFLLREYGRLDRRTARGILSSDFLRDGVKNNLPLYFFSSRLLMNFICRPDFISYSRDYPRFYPHRICRLLGARTACWTSRGKREIAEDTRQFDIVIFELGSDS